MHSPRRSRTASTSRSCSTAPLAQLQGVARAGQHHAGAAAALLARLNPVERVWLHLKARFLSLRLLNDYKAIVTAASRAWRRLRRDTGRLTSLTSYPWIMRIRPQVKH